MKQLTVCLLLLCLLVTLAAPANALEYAIEPPNGPEYGNATSVDPIYTADRGETPNVDRGKNTALVPPNFGSPTSYLPGSGELLAHNTAWNGNVDPMPEIICTPAYTGVADGLSYADGSMGLLRIPSLGVEVQIYEGTDSTQLAKGVGHFPGTSIWDGNVAIAGHNRGVNTYFGEIHKMSQGDAIILTTKLGTRTYAVANVFKVRDTDTSMLTATEENCITLFTCVKNEPAYRWCVYAIEIV